MEPWKFATPWQQARNAHIAAELGLSPEQSHIVHVDGDGCISYTAAPAPLVAELHRRVLAAGLHPSRSLQLAAGC